MALSINNNLMDHHTAGKLGTHYARLSAATRRLSSGLRVSTAADDAAGLAIRELMRADISSLNQGIRNANDAISMIQTADGALAVIDEKLIRMKELAEQAATGTYDSTQRLIIDSEFQQMALEIDRIANATDFNGIKLLDGSLRGEHDGSDLNATGKMKIHFGTGNNSAEDYYYVEIGDCTLAGLGLAEKTAGATGGGPGTSSGAWSVKTSQAADAVASIISDDLTLLGFGYSGHTDSLGVFTDAAKGAALDSSMDSGIILSTGRVEDATLLYRFNVVSNCKSFAHYF